MGGSEEAGDISKCRPKNRAAVGLPCPFWFHIVYVQLSYSPLLKPSFE